MRTFKIYILALVALLVAGCTSSVRDVNGKDDLFSTFFSYQGIKSTINEDTKHYEDRVNTLAMFVIRTGGMNVDAYEFMGEQEISSQTTLKTPPVKVKAGLNDIYFIANATEDEMDGLVTRADIYNYLTQKQELDAELNSGATTAKGFPMSRVYYNQNIPDGHDTPEDAYPWKPTVDANKPLLPVSSYGKDIEVGISQPKVGLVRAVARIKITFTGEGLADLKEVTYHNAETDYTLHEQKAINPVSTDKELAWEPSEENNNQALFYVPERLYPKDEIVTWNNVNEDQNTINYFTITTNGGRTLKVPIVNRGTNSQDVLSWSKTGTQDYSVVRNNSYEYKVNLTKKTMTVTLKVLPWDLLSYERVVELPSLEEDSPLVYEINNEGKAETEIYTVRPIKFATKDDVGVYHLSKGFIVKVKFAKGNGAKWRATLNNGVHYKITADENEIKEILGESSLEANMEVSSGGVIDTNKTYIYKIEPVGGIEERPKKLEAKHYIVAEGYRLGELRLIELKE